MSWDDGFLDSEWPDSVWPEDEECPHDECDEDGVCYECGQYVQGRDKNVS